MALPGVVIRASDLPQHQYEAGALPRIYDVELYAVNHPAVIALKI